MAAPGGRPGELVLVDTHLHLDDRRFDEDREAVLRRAREAGVRAVLTCGADLASSRKNLRLAEQVGGAGPDPHAGGAGAARVWVAVGIHPHEAGRCGDLDEAERSLESLASHPAVVAIGEIGLDFHYDFAPREDQQRVFERQLDLARRLGKPVVVHAREAEEAVLAAIRRHDGVRGVLHAFAGTPGQAQQALELGWFLGVGGMLTFQRAERMREVARRAPLERLLLETDAPYLAPVPYRGRRNEPAYVATVAEALARLRGIDVGEVAAKTTRAASELFGVLP